jgi:hypothetical protein
VDLQENGDCGLLPTKAPSSETDRAAELRGVGKKLTRAALDAAE